VIANLAEIGIAREDIEIGSQVPYGSPSVSVSVQVGELPQIGQAVLDAVEEVLGRSESHGVRFSLTEQRCDQALAQARRQAVDQADKTAADLAQALGVNRGGVIGAIENPLTYFGFGPTSTDTCGSQLQDPYVVEVEPFDAEPKVEVAVSLQVTYAIEPATQPTNQP
jgi:uncharacterized protein YggE